MGFLEKISNIFKKGGKENESREEEEEKKEEYVECAFCGKELKKEDAVKFGGKYWHKKCLRKARKGAKSLI